MEQSSGQICVSVSWKAMKITGIDDRRYWNHIPSDESRLDPIIRNIFCHLSILHGFGFDFGGGNLFPEATSSDIGILYFQDFRNNFNWSSPLKTIM